MWSALRVSSDVDPKAISFAQVLESTLRALIVGIIVVCLVWVVLAGMVLTDELHLRATLIAVMVVLSGAFALYLVSRRFVLAQAVWQVGLIASITLAIVVFRQPMFGLFYALLPLIAVLTMGGVAALFVEGVVAATVWGLLPHLVPRELALTSVSPAIIVGGALNGLIGWLAARAQLTVAQWSLHAWERARKEAEEARQQRVEFMQVQEDLIRANRGLARLSDRLKAMHQLAEEARQAKEEFVANVSHELRTPLNMIIGFSEMIPKLSHVYGITLPPALLSDIAAIQRNSQHLAKLVDDVLDLSRIEAGRLALARGWNSLQDILDEAALAVRALYESKELFLQIRVPADLPAIFCDGTRIRQVVLNLLSNAGRFTEEGGVTVSAYCQDQEIVVLVADTGPGIAEEDQEKLFQPFQQLDGSINRRHGGSGLGLSISKRFVEMHGGKMWLESRVGVGTTIYFSLPLETASLAGTDPDETKRWFSPYDEYEYRERRRRSKAPVPEVAPRLVVLEKGKTLARLLSRYLHDCEIVSVPDADSALQQLNHSPARALVVNSPILDNFPAHAERLRSLPFGTPTVMCWVPGEDETAERLGVVRYLVKPVTYDTVLATLDELPVDVRTVLLVDDEPEVLRLFTRMLTLAQRGYRILQTTSGQRALSLLRERHPDVVLLDLIMPGMDGFQVLQAKSADASIREIPVVIVSSRDPRGEPIVSNTLTVTRGGGLSGHDLLDCICAISEILAPLSRPDRARPKMPPV